MPTVSPTGAPAVLVTLSPSHPKLCLVSVHWPHNGQPLDDFMAALASLDDSLQPFARKNVPICLMGDLNVDLCSEDGVRTTALQAHPCALGLDH